MITLKHRLILILIAVANITTAQKQTVNWYFGNGAGISFATGNPVVLTDGALVTAEGCSSISDCDGNLLFYTNGVVAFTKNHTPMPNGTFLMGHASSSQSALIVPHPGYKNSFYIFTTDAQENNFANGARYSEVDMTLNGGLGDVTSTKNILLHTPVCEKITAVGHANGIDFWVIVRESNSNAFRAYLVSKSGVSSTAVISAIGENQSNNGKGCMKASSDGKHIATALESAIFNPGYIELFNFDNATGMLSNNITLNSNPLKHYGVEFSADGKKLYFSLINPNTIIQYDLSLANTAAIIASRTAIGTTSAAPQALQIGVDKKIYVSSYNSSYLGVINTPEQSGINCGFVENGVYLQGKKCQLGLPEFCQSYFSDSTINPLNIGPDTAICESAELTLASNVSASNYLWSNGSTDSTIVITTPGTYNLSVVVDCKTFTDAITITSKNCTNFQIPNVLTPNADGENDIFMVSGLPSKNYSLEIYTRWGEKIYAANDYANDWDGKGATSGTYYYNIKNNQGNKYSGIITIFK